VAYFFGATLCMFRWPRG